MSEFNIVDSLAQWVGQFLPDTLPATTNDSYGYQLELYPGSLHTSIKLKVCEILLAVF